MVNIKIEGGKLWIHDSLVPQNDQPLILTMDRNEWGKETELWKGDYFHKGRIFRRDWWYIKASLIPVVDPARVPSRARFNAKRGCEWIDPKEAVCGPGVRVYKNPDGKTWCFIRVAEEEIDP
jgi:hypothetical protein